jgi:hypothetical protein
MTAGAIAREWPEQAHHFCYNLDDRRLEHRSQVDAPDRRFGVLTMRRRERCASRSRRDRLEGSAFVYPGFRLPPPA